VIYVYSEQYTNQVHEGPKLAVASPRVVGDLQVHQTGHGSQDLGLNVGQLIAAQLQAIELGDVVECLGLNVRN